MEPAIATILDSAAGAASKASFKALFSILLEAAASRFGSLIAGFTTSFEAHLAENFERCAKVKTILNRSAPVDIVSIYVNTKLKKDSSIVDDLFFLENIDKIKRSIVSGTGGGGKTIFMKYIWFTIFNNPQGRVPVFVELRKLNILTNDDLMSYVFHTVTADGGKDASEAAFKRAVSEGVFVFIFDGLDEVNSEKRPNIERQIQKLGADHPNAIIIVSGRPDDKFQAWHNFHHFTVRPFDDKQVFDLIGKLEYDKGTKKSFLSKIKDGSLDRHRSFLSTPLLCTMMLLTFDQFSTMPDKEYLFYEQAFDTLFLKHDATKDGFKRQHYAKLAIDDFRKCFSHFCLLTYHDQKYMFSNADLLENIEKSLRICGVNVDKELFSKDMIESICLMQVDGLTITFTHRSFQEYFCAYCLAHHIDGFQFREILLNIVDRRYDGVFRMLSDMKKNKLSRDFFIHELERILKDDKRLGVSKDLEAFMRYFDAEFSIYKKTSKGIVSFYPMMYSFSCNYSIVSNAIFLYRDYISSELNKKMKYGFNDDWQKIYDDALMAPACSKNTLCIKVSGRRRKLSISTKQEIHRTDFWKKWQVWLWALREIHQSIKSSQKTSYKTIDEIFQLGR